MATAIRRLQTRGGPTPVRNTLASFWRHCWVRRRGQMMDLKSSDLPARGVFDRFQSRISRRGMLKGAGVTGLGVLAGYTGYLRTRAQESPEVQEMLNVASTLETVAVTFFGVARDRHER